MALAAILLLACNSDSAPAPRSAKNVILIIGDGMGVDSVGFLLQYGRQSTKGRQRLLHFERLLREGETGIVLTYPLGNLVTDSAASSSQMATGEMAYPGAVGLDSRYKPVETILERAGRIGKSRGLVTNTRVSDATPASFITHVVNRSKENDICDQYVKSDVEVLFGGGLRNWLPKSINHEDSKEYKKYASLIPKHIKLSSKRNDEKDIIDLAKKSGYEVLFSKDQLNRSRSEKVLGLFASSYMPDVLTHRAAKEEGSEQVPSLTEMTAKALEILSRDDDGFFLVVESGLIDLASHFNDAGALLHEMLELDRTIGAVLSWMEHNPNSILIVTADHGTGAFTFAYSRRPTQESPMFKEIAGERFSTLDFGAPRILDMIYGQAKSCEKLYSEFMERPKEKRTAAELARLINRSYAFKITEREAARLLETEPNEYRVPGHQYFDYEISPRLEAYKEFYDIPETAWCGLLARQLAKYQHVGWATGAHTNAPVLIVAYGPQHLTQVFDGVHHVTELHKLILRAADLE
jgi:alkaline phosphatase